MRKPDRFATIYFLLILALITAGISPACKFISGQSDYIEICTAFGIQTISVTEDTAPSSGHQHKGTDQCSFCSFAQNGKSFAHADIVADKKLFSIKTAFPAWEAHIAIGYEPSVYEARAPPIFS